MSVLTIIMLILIALFVALIIAIRKANKEDDLDG